MTERLEEEEEESHRLKDVYTEEKLKTEIASEAIEKKW